MGMFNRFFRREVVIKGDSQPSASVQGGDYRENVIWVRDGEKGMKISAVYRAVNLLASSAAVLRLQYKRRDRAKDYFKLFTTGEGGKMNYLLAVRPNERQNAYTVMKYLVSQLLLKGNAFIYPEKNMFGGVEALYLCSPDSVTYDVYSNTYTINDVAHNIYKTVTADEILHFKNYCNDGGYWGKSTIHYAAITLGIAATSDSETLKRFATGGRFKAILQNNQSVRGFGENQDSEMKGLADKLQQSLNRGDDVMFIPGDGQLTPISMSSSDMQFLESRKFTIREIARFFGIPPSKLMDDTNSNYKSVEVSNIAFYSEALQPILEEIECEFAAKMLTADNWMEYKYCFDLRDLYALDLESKGKWDRARLDTGQASVNELRRENDREPVDGGDEIYLSVNMAPLGSEKLRGKSENREDKV